MFESIPPSILRYIASFTYPISATVCKQWAQHLSLSAIQEDFGIETVECYTQHIAKHIIGPRTTTAITNSANLKYISEEVKCLSISDEEFTEMNLQIKNFLKLEKLSGYELIEDMHEIIALQHLKYLSLSMSRETRNVSEIAKLGKLETLHIYTHESRDLSFLQQCEALETFVIYGHMECDVDISQFCHNPKIKNLEIHSCYIQRFDDFRYFAELKSLSISFEDILTFGILGRLVQLVSLKLKGNTLRDISHIQYLVNLKNLEIVLYDYDDHIACINELGYLVQLESLVLQGFYYVENISFLQHLTQLNQLVLNRFDRVTDISPLRYLSQLEKLTLETKNRNITDFSYFAYLTNLKHLTLCGIFNLEDTRCINGMNKLKHLTLDQCCSIRDIRGLPPQLNSLNLVYLKSLQDLSQISCLPLDSLCITHCNGIRDLSMLRNVKSLTLKLLYMANSLESLGQLVQLESLCVWYAQNVNDISPIANLTNLNSLALESFYMVTDISCLQSLTQLRHLTIESFPQIVDLAWLKYLKELNYIKLNNLPDVAMTTIHLNEINAYKKIIH
jgi:hypothetical protein